jgi:hypothetical protein
MEQEGTEVTEKMQGKTSLSYFSFPLFPPVLLIVYFPSGVMANRCV